MGKYEYIDSLRNDPTETTPVWKMCLWLAVSTSGFYDWLKRPQSATAARREALAARVRHFFTASDGTYGYRRIHADLAAEGVECSPELVRQIMGTCDTPGALCEVTSVAAGVVTLSKCPDILAN